MRRVFFVFAIIVLTQSITDRQILQQILNGGFKENGLPNPTTIIPCVDDTTAHTLVLSIGNFLSQASDESVTDYNRLFGGLNGFFKDMPQSVLNCLLGNKERESFYSKNGVRNSEGFKQISKRYLQYLSLHYLQAHKWFDQANNFWTKNNYYQVGYSTATFTHKILLAKPMQPNLADKEILQQALNGGFEQNKLPYPVTIVPYIDDNTAHTIVLFITYVLAKSAKGSISDFVDVVNMIKDFGNYIPQSVKDCLDGNQQLSSLLIKYGIDSSTNITEIERKYLNYTTLHYLQVHKWFVDVNAAWLAGKYYQVGYNSASYSHKILGMSTEGPNLSDSEILQLTLNGAYEQNKLPDPQTIMPCVDDDTAHQIVLFITKILAKSAKASLSDLIQIRTMVKDFINNQVPEQVKDCLDGNQQISALYLKYGIDNNTDHSVIEKKVISYLTLHFLQLHKWFGDANMAWLTGQQYYQVGFSAATMCHKILAMNQHLNYNIETRKQRNNKIYEIIIQLLSLGTKFK